MPLCSIPSPAFLVGSVGMGLFDSAKAGFLLYGSVILASLVASFLLRLGRSNPPTQTVSAPSPPPRPCSALLFTEAVMASMEGMIRVCSFVLTFSCVGALLDCMLAWLPIRFPSVFSSLLYGTLEMTGGIFSLSALPSSQALPAVALLSGWSGLSVHAQLFSLCGHLFSFRTYWQTKLLCAVLCPLLVLLGLFLFS